MNGNSFYNAVSESLCKDGKCPEGFYVPILHLLEWTRKDDFDDYDVTRAVKEITEIGPHQEKKPRHIEEDRLSGAMMIKRIEPVVESIRQEVFGSKDAPLNNFNAEEVLKWRNEQHKIEHRYIKTQDEKDKPLDLRLLDFKAEEISKASGFDRWAVIFFVLAGIPPKFFKWSVSSSFNRYQLPDASWLRNTEITITFRTRDLSFPELKKAYTSIKKDPLRTGEKEKRNFYSPKREEKRLRVFEFVSSREKSPGIGPAKWKPLWIAWNKKYPRDRYGDWQALRRNYERTLSRHPEYRSS